VMEDIAHLCSPWGSGTWERRALGSWWYRLSGCVSQVLGSNESLGRQAVGWERLEASPEIDCCGHIADFHGPNAKFSSQRNELAACYWEAEDSAQEP
jgi:hypothetical protein